jgi:hypothetical protein
LQAVLEKQSYILLSRNDVENLMRLEPANISLQNSSSELDNSLTDAEAVEVETELSDLLLDMCPIKQVMTITNLTFFVFSLFLTDESCIYLICAFLYHYVTILR